jgi:glucokinase
MQSELAIGVDVGATKIAAALVSRQGVILAEERLATAPQAGVPAVVERVEAAIAALTARAPGPIAGVGIGTPGFVDSTQGIVRNAVNLGWAEVALAEEVHRSLEGRLPVWIDNDANVQALGEVIFGAGRGLDNVVYIAIGSGLGSGVVINGRLVSGATYTAAELGHLSLDPEGRRCACGMRGCVETVVSGPGLVASVRERLAAGRPSSLKDTPGLTAEAVVAAGRAGDDAALAALAETARWLGIVFAACVVILNPAALVVGGGLGHSAFDLLIPGARAELARRALPQCYAELQVLASEVHSTAVGAAALVWQAR